MPMRYTIRQVSDMTGLSAHVLRYYEREGLLPPVGRSESGIRHYADEDIECIGLIVCLKNTGMSLKQIKTFMDLSQQGDETLKTRCEMLTEHKKNVEMQIEEMQRHLKKVCCKIDCFTRMYEQHRSKTAPMNRCG